VLRQVSCFGVADPPIEGNLEDPAIPASAVKLAASSTTARPRKARATSIGTQGGVSVDAHS
jgi:hypothetical protein